MNKSNLCRQCIQSSFSDIKNKQTIFPTYLSVLPTEKKEEKRREKKQKEWQRLERAKIKYFHHGWGVVLYGWLRHSILRYTSGSHDGLIWYQARDAPVFVCFCIWRMWSMHWGSRGLIHVVDALLARACQLQKHVQWWWRHISKFITYPLWFSHRDTRWKSGGVVTSAFTLTNDQ